MPNTKTQVATDIDAGKAISSMAAGGKMRAYQADVTLAAQASGDTIELMDLPANFQPMYLMLAPSATLGAATIAIGIAGTPEKYRTAATVTAGGTNVVAASILTAKERLIATVGAAALPGAGTLKVVVVGVAQGG